jgi:flagellin-like protein
MMKFRENEDAVSPVIGVILMVAITVILAAVIAAFVFGMGSNVQTTKTVAVTASQSGDKITVTYHGGGDADTLNFLKTTVLDKTDDTHTKYCYAATDATKFTVAASTATLNKNEKVPVGATIVFDNVGTTGRDHVLVVGYFMDGSEHVVLDTHV